ncbi:retrovirus-related Pol polyprotein from transposon opus [Trichonephila clavipes]|nr:retrovirus-related Pol polyprotein from transposon opus [Trichonephila clavipes]
MDEESKPFTAFTTHNAVYQWKTMPFGLAGASGTFQREMNRILKYLIQRGGKHGPDEDKILAIKRLIRPTTKKNVRSVFGLLGFYRAYIPNYAEISTPLTELTKKNKPNDVSWGEAEQNSFVKLKELLCEVTSLATPDANLPFQVHCDASDYGVGCCLTQQDTDGINRPIAFASQKFNATQKN